MNRFSEKLNQLVDTVQLLHNDDVHSLAHALSASRDDVVIAIGSGGSVVSAKFFARCRATLFQAQTLVQTPMEFVLSSFDISKASVWLFTAGANNADISAVLDVALSSNVDLIHIVTRNPDGEVAKRLSESGKGVVHQIPAADNKDGFLATHSLVGTVGSLLIASNQIASDPIEGDLQHKWQDAVSKTLSQQERSRVRNLMDGLNRNSTLVILADPQLLSVAEVLQTSCWEAALCPVQLTDFRNFAHGRHVWLEQREDETSIVALKGDESHEIWGVMENKFPDNVHKSVFDFGGCGRFENAVGIVMALVIIEAIGSAVCIDPAKPGVGEFGRELYSDDTLQQIARRTTEPIRQKRRAVLERDEVLTGNRSIESLYEDFLSDLTCREYNGVILDYDGTIVNTDERFDPPRKDILAEICRLVDAGAQMGIATGRGGSAGEMLRTQLPDEYYDKILMGYYNGGHIRNLGVDIRQDPPPLNQSIDLATQWLQSETSLAGSGAVFRYGAAQITIDLKHIVEPKVLSEKLSKCPPIEAGSLKFIQSGHSIDILPVSSTKSSIGIALKQLSSLPSPRFLSIGDSGARSGNDNEMLCFPCGVSVGSVCGRHPGTWSLFGDSLEGVDAVLRILRALKVSEDGALRLDIVMLKDSVENGT